MGGAVKARFQGGDLWRAGTVLTLTPTLTLTLTLALIPTPTLTLTRRAGTVAEHNEDGTLDVLCMPTGLEPRTSRLRARPQGTHTPQRSSASRQVCYSHA